jgi:2-polyprenyl-3-methyl-5-hydroxy-6-metoxy-1,4-benzoquinol methylase
MNTSGNGKNYYGIELQGKKYSGERNWDSRWNLIKDCLDFTGKRVLDIGCNIGISLIYLSKFRNISYGFGIDAPDEFLIETNKAETFKCANLLKCAFDIDNVHFIQLDLNTQDYTMECILPKYDVVIAMSILKWIDDKDKFMNYLSGFDNVIYEGHESDETEILRFEKYGFKYKILGQTQIGESYNSNEFRTLFLFSK